MNQLVRVSRPLYFLLLLSFWYGFFQPSALSAGSCSGVAAGEHLPRRHTASGSDPCGGKPYGGAGLAVPPAPSHRGRRGVSSR